MPTRAKRSWVGSRVALALVTCIVLLPATPAGGGPSARVESYRGLGAWVDIFDRSLYGDPEGTVAMLAAHGVDTLYLQTATYRFPGPVRFPDLAGRFLDAAHAGGMKVVAWYVPDFADMRRDYDWSVAAIRFASPSGERFDSFALDIEVTAVTDPNERAARLLELSRQIRAAAGPAYPLGAITPSPLRSPGYWPVFPDRELAQIYDAYLPMAYWSYHANGEAAARDYISRSAQIVRTVTGRPDMPIHMIGGLADGAEAEESRGFVSAVNDSGLIGASLYDAASSGPEDWAALRALRFPEPNPSAPEAPEEPKGLQLGRDLGTYGSIEGADRRFQGEVTFEAPPLRGTWEVDYEAFGFGRRRGEILVNGDRAAAVPATGERWSARHTAVLPDELLDDDGSNAVTFRRNGGGRWAVREATLSGAPLPLGDRGAHGAIPASDPGRRDRVTYEFEGPAQAMVVTARGFDVGRGEVAISLDGVTIDWLPETSPRLWGSPAAIVVEPVRSGTHRLTFDARGTGEDPWAVRLDAEAPVALV